MLKRTEQMSARRRLGESLARLLKEHEPMAAVEDATAVVFMTEVAEEVAEEAEQMPPAAEAAPHMSRPSPSLRLSGMSLW